MSRAISPASHRGYRGFILAAAAILAGSVSCQKENSPEVTKALPENPDFTVVGRITSASVEEGYITTSFTLSEDDMAKMWKSDYVVSLLIEDTDGIHGASTSFVPVSWHNRDGEGAPNDSIYEEVFDSSSFEEQ